jgi:putative NIF3 family GTP cyclohydrolase 1 type 2
MKIGLELANWKKIPYDSAIHVRGKSIRKVLLTIDVTIAEIMLAKSMQCDAVIGHHPIGTAALNFHRVFDRHIDYMLQHNIPKDIAKHAVEKLKAKAELRAHANIYNNVVSAAKILKMPLVNIHQPCDEYMRQVILRAIKAGRTEYVSDIVKSLSKIPEFQHAATKVRVRFGNQDNKAGHWALVVAAGTNGGFHIAKAYLEYGVSTVIYLHIDYGELTKMREEKLDGNLVVMGHLAGDSIGLNGLAERLEDLGIETVRVGILPNR